MMIMNAFSHDVNPCSDEWEGLTLEREVVNPYLN